MMRKKLSSTIENYLEAIFRIEKEKRVARVRDISQYLGVARSTVNAALKSLADKKLIEYTPYELIALTEEGRQEAVRIVVNHKIISDFLRNVLSLEQERAERVACDMEHAVDREVVERFVCFLAFMDNSNRNGRRWIDEFRIFMHEGSEGRSCREHIQDYLQTIHLDIGVESKRHEKGRRE